MMGYNQFFANAIATLKSEGRYRDFRRIRKCVKKFPFGIDENNREVAIWCSNDYMGMGVNEDVLQSAHDCLDKYGVGAGGTRNIAGTTDLISDLEMAVANLHDKDSGLVFTSGYVANHGTIIALARIIPNLVIFSDSENHASIIAGIRNSRAEKHIFRHNDINHLRELLSLYSNKVPKIIVFESIYSMDGDCADIASICNLAQEYSAMTYIDEVHAVGMYGDKGGGLTDAYHISEKLDIIQGTFGKAFGTIGGYIVGNTNIIDAIRSISGDIIFTTAMSPVIANATLTSMQILMRNNELRIRHKESVSMLKDRLRDNGITFIDNKTHIVPVIIGDPQMAAQLSMRLFDKHALYVQHINYPTVKRGTERLRITATPHHNEDMINILVSALSLEMRNMSLL